MTDTVNNFATGCQPDTPDPRDKLLAQLYAQPNQDTKEIYQTIVEMAEKRTKVTLEDSCPPVYNQLDISSCVANATAAALRFAWKNTVVHLANSYEEFDPSRLWIYYYARLLRDSRLEHMDSGSQIRDALKALQTKGVCKEQDWPYLTKQESYEILQHKLRLRDQYALPLNTRVDNMPQTARDAKDTKFIDFTFDYHRIRSFGDNDLGPSAAADTVVKQMCACLAEGYPIIFGFRMYQEVTSTKEEFFNENNWTPDHVFTVDNLTTRGKDVGGHAVLCVGFDSDRKLFRIMNSWGTNTTTYVDNKGFFWMPFAWFETGHVTSDLWTIRPHLAPLLRDHDPVE